MGEWSEWSMKSVQKGMTVTVSCNYFIQILLYSEKSFKMRERKYFLFKEQLNCSCIGAKYFYTGWESDETFLQRSNPLKTVRQKGANSDAESSKIPKFCKDRVFWGNMGQHPVGPCEGQDRQIRYTLVLPCMLFSGVKVWILPAVWLVATQAAVCGAGEVLGGRAVHMQVIAGTGMQPNSSGPSGLCHEPKLQAKIRRLLFLVLVIVSSEDVYLLSLTSTFTEQDHLCNFEVSILVFFCLFGFFNALFAVIL